MKRMISHTLNPSVWGALSVLFGSLVLGACGGDEGAANDFDPSGSSSGGGEGAPVEQSGGTSSGGSGGSVPDLDGAPCDAGGDVFDECSSCLCGESGTYDCIFVPGCEEVDPDPVPQPSGPDEVEGQPCDSVGNVSFPCAACFCTDAGTYSCAQVVNCEEFVDDCGNQPVPQASCETGWICNESSWMCLDEPNCPKMAVPADVLCTTQVVERSNPSTGTCCAYSTPCEAPSTWESCGDSVNREL